MDAFKEKTVGCLLAAGVAFTVVGLFLTWLFAVSGIYSGTYTREPVTNRITNAGTLNLVPLALTVVVLGVLMTGGAITYGLWFSKASQTGTRKVVPYARIISRYGFTKNGQMISAAWEFEEALRPRFYVRMQTSPTDIAEYECVDAVFWSCGEGMVGEAEIQGKWLGKFVPYIGTPSS